MQSSLLHNTHTFRATQALVVPALCEEEQLLQSPDTARTLQTTKVRWRSASFLQQSLCFPEWWTPSFRGLTGWLSSEVEEQSRGALGSRAAHAMFMQPPAIISQMTSYQSRFKPTQEGASKPYFLSPPHLTCFLHLIMERVGKASFSVLDTFLFLVRLAGAVLVRNSQQLPGPKRFIKDLIRTLLVWEVQLCDLKINCCLLQAQRTFQLLQETDEFSRSYSQSHL